MLERQQHPPDQRIAHHEPRAASAGEAVEPVTAEDFCGVHEGRAALAEAEQVVDIGAVHHHAAEDREFGDRGPDEAKILAELPSVEREGFEGSPAQGGALVLLLVIRMGRVGPEMDRALALETRDCGRPALQKGLLQNLRRVIAHDRGHVSGRRFRGVPRLDLRGVEGVRDPALSPPTGRRSLPRYSVRSTNRTRAPSSAANTAAAIPAAPAPSTIRSYVSPSAI